MLFVVRAIVALVAIVLGLAGLLVAAIEPDGLAGAAWLIASAVVLLVALVWERGRYRADGTDEARRAMAADPGGSGADEPLPPRFRPTDEVFVDPTTNRRMRVWLDARTGDRRYRPEA